MAVSRRCSTYSHAAARVAEGQPLEQNVAMTRDQRIVLIGAASGVATMIAAMALLYGLWPVDPGMAEFGRRFSFTLQAAAFAALPLLISIMTVGNNRFLTEAIDPT